MSKGIFFNKIRNKIIFTMILFLTISTLAFFLILNFGEEFFYKHFHSNQMNPFFNLRNEIKLESKDYESIAPIKISLDPIEFSESKELKHTSFNIFLFCSLVFVIAFYIVSLAFLFDKRIKYLEYISQSLKGISEGDFQIKLKVNGNDELSFLADGINIMAEKLQEKFLEERELLQSKNELITNLSHDLKSPLTSIIGYTTLINESKNINNEEKIYAETILKNSMRLKNRLEELFELTKLNSPKLVLNYEMINISKLIRQYHKEQESILNQVGLSSKILVEEDVYFNINIENFIRVFDNIYANAIKYATKPSEFGVELSRVEGKTLIIFKNYFENASSINLSKIFDEFYREDEARTDKDGTGLGLFIVRKIIDLHKGRVWAEIEENKYFLIKIEL